MPRQKYLSMSKDNIHVSEQTNKNNKKKLNRQTSVQWNDQNVFNLFLFLLFSSEIFLCRCFYDINKQNNGRTTSKKKKNRSQQRNEHCLSCFLANEMCIYSHSNVTLSYGWEREHLCRFFFHFVERMLSLPGGEKRERARGCPTEAFQTFIIRTNEKSKKSKEIRSECCAVISFIEP